METPIFKIETREPAQSVTVLDAIARQSKSVRVHLAKSDGSTDSLEKVEQFYEDINKYMLWLYYSLTHGLPLEVNITPTLPISAYVAAFKFIKQELIIGKLPDDVAKELIIYLDYLIERFFP